MKEEVNETLNQIIVNIASGVNYASDLAKKTGKSIPVMFRQLDSLITKGILTKERKGKRVEYEIRWISMAKTAASFVKSEFENASRILTGLKVPNIDLKELQGMMERVFLTRYFQEIFTEMYQDIEYASKVSYEYAKMKFNDSMGILLQTFGVLSEKEEKEILSKVPENERKNMKKFIEISKMHKKIKNEIDPTNRLRKKL